ncbi:MAG: hypothetical protein RJA70_4828, partial [Pseudomonadota bacterium]
MAEAPELTTTLDDNPRAKLERTLTAPVDAQEPSGPTPVASLPIIARAHYELGEEIARGGLGRIIRARDLRLNRDVAIKELLKPTPTSEARFLREIEITARLEHPSIVTIHEAGYWPDGQLFYSMNFVAGEMLGRTMARAITSAQRLALLPHLIAISEAVAYAHSQGVVHRDLKPANVLVGKFGETVVIDWGLAKYANDPSPETGNEPRSLEPTSPPNRETSALTKNLTRAGGVVGTPPYMAPEQARGAEVNATADVYAIGAILYESLCGKEPYDGYSDARLLIQIEQHSPVPLQDLEPDLPPDLLAIVSKAMHRDREQRYAHAGEMARELQRFATGRLVSAYSYSPWDLLTRFARRHAAALATALVAALLLASLALTLVRRIQAERDTATHLAEVARQERDVAELRAEELIVSEARALERTDPTVAVNQLKRLKPGSEPRGSLSVLLGAEEEGVARSVLRGHTGAVRCLDFSPDSQSIVSGSDDKSLRVWSLKEQQSTRTTPHSDRITTCSFVNEGRQIASGGYDQRLIISDTVSLTHSVLGKHETAIKATAYLNRNQLLVSASSEALRVWHLENGNYEELRTTNPRWPNLSFSPDGHTLLSGSHVGQFQRSQLSTPEPRAELSPTHLNAIAGQWLGDGNVLLATQQGELFTWRANGALDPLVKLPDRADSLVVTAPSSSQPRAFAAGEDGRVWQVDLASTKVSLLYRHSQAIEVLKISPDGRFLASAGVDKVVRVLDLERGAVRQFKGHADVVSGLAFSSDGQWLASASWDATIRIWPLRGALHNLRRVIHAHDVGVHAARFSHDGRLFASGGHDDHVKLWSTSSNASHTLDGHTDHVYRVLFSPDDRHIATSSDDQTVRVWPVPEMDAGGGFMPAAQNSPPLVLSGHSADVEEIAFSPDGQLLVSCAEDRTARLWHLPDGGSRELSHDGNVTQIVFNPAGTRFATASLGGDVRVFDTTGENLAVFRDHPGEVYALGFTQAGELVSVDDSGVLVVRNAALGHKRTHGGFEGARLLAFSPDGNWLALNGNRPHLWLCPWGNLPTQYASLKLLDACQDLNAHMSQIHSVR